MGAWVYNTTGDNVFGSDVVKFHINDNIFPLKMANDPNSSRLPKFVLCLSMHVTPWYWCCATLNPNMDYMVHAGVESVGSLRYTGTRRHNEATVNSTLACYGYGY